MGVNFWIQFSCIKLSKYFKFKISNMETNRRRHSCHIWIHIFSNDVLFPFFHLPSLPPSCRCILINKWIKWSEITESSITLKSCYFNTFAVKLFWYDDLIILHPAFNTLWKAPWINSYFIVSIHFTCLMNFMGDKFFILLLQRITTVPFLA